MYSSLNIRLMFLSFLNRLLDEVSLLPISLMKIKSSAGPNAVPCDTTEMTCIQDKLNPRWQRVEEDSWGTILTKKERDRRYHMARHCDGNWPKSPVSSHKTEKLLYRARSFVWFVIHRQALTEGTVLRFLEETGPPFQHEHPSQAKA